MRILRHEQPETAASPYPDHFNTDLTIFRTSVQSEILAGSFDPSRLLAIQQELDVLLSPATAVEGHLFWRRCSAALANAYHDAVVNLGVGREGVTPPPQPTARRINGRTSTAAFQPMSIGSTFGFTTFDEENWSSSLTHLQNRLSASPIQTTTPAAVDSTPIPPPPRARTRG